MLFPTHTLYPAHAHPIISDVCAQAGTHTGTDRYSYRYRQALIQVQTGTHTGTDRYMYMCLLIISHMVQMVGHSYQLPSLCANNPSIITITSVTQYYLHNIWRSIL